MTITGAARESGERRRVERRANARVADLTLPEFRRIVVTSLLFTVVLVLFVWMVRTVIIAAILGIVIAVYVRPLYRALARRLGRRHLAAILTLAAVILPVLGAIAYSYREILDVAKYLGAHQDEIATRIDASLHRIRLLRDADTGDTVRRWVLLASNYGAAIPGVVRNAVVSFSVATTIFLFTAAYAFTDADAIVNYLRGKLPPRYTELAAALETNVRGVLYGAIYATLWTQALKSAVIFVMNLAFGVPLAGVLAILSFIIGFFPIVGSWSIYGPVAAWLLVWQGSPVKALLMVVIGLLINTLFISMYLRPKLAADRSRVLNFYWMFVGLVTGVYTFGLPGILLGPILIGLLKAVVDTVTTHASWRYIEREGEPGDERPEVMA